MADRLDLVTIANRALARLGAGMLSSLDEETDLARSVSSVLADTIDMLVARHQWNFARRTVRLDEAGPAEDRLGWRHAYQLPERLHACIKVLRDPRAPDHPERRFAIEGRMLYCDASPVWATFIVATDPELWPPAFRTAVIVAVAAALAVPVTGDIRLHQHLHEEAFGAPQMMGRGGLFAEAIAQEVASNVNRAPLWMDDPLTEARWG
jgi:hypothetical protein